MPHNHSWSALERTGLRAIFFEQLSVLFSSNLGNIGAMKALFEKYNMQIVGPPMVGA